MLLSYVNSLGKGSKIITIDSVIMIIPRGGGRGQRVSDHTSLGFFSNASNLFVLLLDTRKQTCLLTPNYIVQIYCNLLDPLILNSHLSWVEIGPSVICAVLLKVGQKNYKICFLTYPSTTLFENGAGKK